MNESIIDNSNFPPSSDNDIPSEFFRKPILISDERLKDAAITYCIWSIVLLFLFSIIQSQSILYKFRLVRQELIH